ncbi:hypothetical protein LCGC14_2961740 [marine sediment metagenome]|uniref:Uncharacterized protein n=1 Tax=marine sediment metagenome TaxID=412755 RepID=A0A0F8XCV8_9ZZZZ
MPQESKPNRRKADATHFLVSFKPTHHNIVGNIADAIDSLVDRSGRTVHGAYVSVHELPDGDMYTIDWSKDQDLPPDTIHAIVETGWLVKVGNETDLDKREAPTEAGASL